MKYWYRRKIIRVQRKWLLCQIIGVCAFTIGSIGIFYHGHFIFVACRCINNTRDIPGKLKYSSNYVRKYYFYIPIGNILTYPLILVIRKPIKIIIFAKVMNTKKNIIKIGSTWFDILWNFTDAIHIFHCQNISPFNLQSI